MTGPCVYRVYDADDRLIYVGATINLEQRMAHHRTQSWWHGIAYRVSDEPHETIASALASERVAIANERPAFNLKRALGWKRNPYTLTEADKQLARDWVASKRRGGVLPCALRWLAS